MVVNGGAFHNLVNPYLNYADMTNPPNMAAGKAVLICRPNSHPFVDRTLSLEQPVKIGRSVARARAAQSNGIFDCKVLSRNHALIWYNNGKFYLQDTSSSNGTFVNNQRLSKSGEESLPREVSSGDIVQFGVDVLENARKVTHGCIVANLKLYLPDGKEAKASPSTSVLSGAGNVSIEELYQLNQHIQEALQREQMLQHKLASLQTMVAELKQNVDDSWKALIAEDRLISRVEMLENQLQTYGKNFGEDKLREEVRKLQEDKGAYQGIAKDCLQKVLQEKMEAVQKCADIERVLQNAEEECTHYKASMEKEQEELKELAIRHTAQLVKTMEMQTKMKDAETQYKEALAKLEAENEELRNEVKMLLANKTILQEKIQELETSGEIVGRQLLGIQSQLGLNQSSDIHNHLSTLKQRNGSTADVICKNNEEELKDENQKDNPDIDSLVNQLMTFLEKQKNAREVVALFEGQVGLLQSEKMAKLSKINTLEAEMEIHEEKLYKYKEENKKLEENLIVLEETLRDEMKNNKEIKDMAQMNGEGDKPTMNGSLAVVVESLQAQVQELKDNIRNSRSKVEAMERTIELRQGDLDKTKKDLSEITQSWLIQDEKLQELQSIKEQVDTTVNVLKEKLKTVENSFSQMKMKEKIDEEPEDMNIHKEEATLLRKQLQEAQQIAKQNKNEAELVKERLRMLTDEMEMMKLSDTSDSDRASTPDSFVTQIDNKSYEELTAARVEIHRLKAHIVLLEAQIKKVKEDTDQKQEELQECTDSGAVVPVEKEAVVQKLILRLNEMEEELVLVKEKYMECNEKNTQLEKELNNLKQDYDTVVHQPFFNLVFLLPLLVLFLAMIIMFHPTLARLLGTSDNHLHPS